MELPRRISTSTKKSGKSNSPRPFLVALIAREANECRGTHFLLISDSKYRLLALKKKVEEQRKHLDELDKHLYDSLPSYRASALINPLPGGTFG